MQVAVRPNLAAAGVALVGASVVAASSIAPLPDVHLPDVHAPAVVERAFDVSLTAASNPLLAYSQVVQAVLDNVNSLISTAKPGQVLGDVLANQSTNIGQALGAVASTGGAVAGALTQVPQALLTAAGQLAAGNIAGATDTLLQLPVDVALPLTNALPALADLITKPLQNVVNVVNAFTSDQLGTMLALSGFIGPLISTPAAAAVAVQNVLAAVATLNPAAIAGAALAAPATIADGLLNGGYGPNLAPLVGLDGFNVFAGGLLAATGITFPDGVPTINTGGPLAGLQQILSKIAGAIAPPAAAATVAIAATDAASIPSATPHTLSLAAPADAAPATKAADTTPAATDTPAKDSVATDGAATEPKAEKPADTTKPAETTKPEVKDETSSAPAKDVNVKNGNKVEPTKAVDKTDKAGDKATDKATYKDGSKPAAEPTDSHSGADGSASKGAA